MKKLILLPLLICLASCGRQTGPSVPKGPTMPVPEFSIRVSLSEAAALKLSDAGETIYGTVYFDGDGTPLSNVKTAPHRDVFLGSYEFELPQAGEVRVSDAVVSQEAYGRLSDTNFHFFINAYSGRRSFRNNVLSGGYADGRLSDLDPEKPIEIKCNLLDKE
jgi:hypothetical protein